MSAPPAQRVLDAGCGRYAAKLELPDDCYVVGIDISPDGLAANPDLDERIVGDLETYPLPAETFDLVVCWDVLEHLRRPHLALTNLTGSLKPAGRLVIGIPNLLTPKALVTKFTPHRFHVFFYRRVLHFPNAGRPGHGPFPTFLRWSLRPSALEVFAARNGLHVDEIRRYPSPSAMAIYDRYPRLTGSLVPVWKLLFGGSDPRDSELRIVLRKTHPVQP